MKFFTADFADERGLELYFLNECERPVLDRIRLPRSWQKQA